MPDRIVLKIPAGDIGWHEINRRDLWKEAGIYARLGRHPCLPTVYSFDPDSCELGLEYMSNSNLHDYLIAHDTEINPKQRLQWVIDMLEGLCHIHRFGILHADLTPRNLLLDDKLLLKICDFAGSSVDGSLPTGIPGRRYIMIHSSSTRDFSIQDELFTLGCTIYHIVTGHAPYHDRNEHEVSEMYERGEFPDISSLLLGEIICKYWTGDLKTAEEGFRAALAHFFSEYFAPKNNAP
jgi:serine/threonine protein kinase